jgi:hypothetical protein
MDAGTLAEANVIEGDKARMKAAQQKAGSMAEDKQEEASAMKDVAKPSGSGPAKSSGPSKGSGKAPSRVPVNSLLAGIPGVSGKK